MTITGKSRIESIDVLRGIVMVIMALDHVRDYFHISANVDDPLNLSTTTPILFFTRWITHFCAPVFVFLSGTSIYLQSLRKSKKELGVFLLKRGLWLILAEWILVGLAWTFDPFFHIIPFQVIWVIGISMVLFGILIMLRISYNIILATGILIVAGHNLLDFIEASPGFTTNFWWDLFHIGKFAQYQYAPGHVALIIYPFPAWTGVMMLGYCTGILFTSKYTEVRRKKFLIRSGITLIIIFIVVRFTNMYGDPVDWSVQKNGFYTFLSFINTFKYPPSLLYLCMTIGPALILLAYIEKFKNRFTDSMVVFGKTAFFYYIIHIFLIHIFASIAFFAREHTFSDAFTIAERTPFLFVIPGEGLSLAWVYLIWITVVIILYPICKIYNNYKYSHKEKWWLSYL